jgi:hypothetical protein
MKKKRIQLHNTLILRKEKEIMYATYLRPRNVRPVRRTREGASTVMAWESSWFWLQPTTTAGLKRQ